MTAFIAERRALTKQIRTTKRKTKIDTEGISDIVTLAPIIFGDGSDGFITEERAVSKTAGNLYEEATAKRIADIDRIIEIVVQKDNITQLAPILPKTETASIIKDGSEKIETRRQ